MNRAERRRQAKIERSVLEQLNKVPKCHLHEKFTQQEVEETKIKIKELLKKYSYKGSNYEDIAPIEIAKREYYQTLKSKNIAIGLAKDYEVVNTKTGQIIETDIFLVSTDSGWFLSYEKLDFQQNLLTTIHELGLEMVFSNRNDVVVNVRGFLIPTLNRVVRQAFDSLSLKYDNKWVA